MNRRLKWLPIKNGSLKLIQTAPDGTETEAAGSLDDGYVEIDVGMLENGTYMYYALAVDEFGNVQVQGEADMPSPIVTVHVLNFRVSDIMGSYSNFSGWCNG